MSDDDVTYIYQVKDSMGGTLRVEPHHSSILNQPGVIFYGNDGPWLTVKQSKRLRKALKAWERSVA